ncbi:hypothetical protein QTN25_002052 [Entamoeba marina]
MQTITENQEFEPFFKIVNDLMSVLSQSKSNQNNEKDNTYKGEEPLCGDRDEIYREFKKRHDNLLSEISIKEGAIEKGKMAIGSLENMTEMLKRITEKEENQCTYLKKKADNLVEQMLTFEESSFENEANQKRNLFRKKTQEIASLKYTISKTNSPQTKIQPTKPVFTTSVPQNDPATFIIPNTQQNCLFKPISPRSISALAASHPTLSPTLSPPDQFPRLSPMEHFTQISPTQKSKTSAQEYPKKDTQIYFVGKQIKTFQDWTSYRKCSVLYDSTTNGCEKGVIAKKIFGRSHLIFVHFDHIGNVFGGYVNTKVSKTEDTLTDPNTFLFTLKKNGKINPQKFHIMKKWEDEAICVNRTSNLVYNFGDDLHISQPGSGNSYVGQIHFNYKGIEKALTDVQYPDKFDVERIVILQMH